MKAYNSNKPNSTNKKIKEKNVKKMENKSMKNLKKFGNSVITIVISVLLLISMLSLLSNSALPSANAQSTTKSTISPSLINYIFAQGSGNASNSWAGIGPGPTTSNVMWTVNIPNAFGVASGAQMCAFGGYVFIMNKTHLLALDGGTGNIAYALPYAGAPQYIGGNYMLIGSRCYTVDTGTPVWTAPAGFSQGLGLVTDPQYLPARMFFGGGCGWTLSDPSKPPTLLWNSTGQAIVPSGTGLAYNDGIMVYSGADQKVLGFNASTGDYLWTTAIPTGATTGPSTAHDGVFVRAGESLGIMFGLNITTGQIIWQFDPRTTDSAWAFGVGSSYGMIYGHNQDGHFYANNATTGALVWDAYTNNGIAYTGSFTIAGGYIYTQMGENQYHNPNTGEFGHSEFCCFDAYNGTLVWSLPFENGAPSNVQCNAYGNLYMIPSTSSSEAGVFTYSGGGGFEQTSSQVMCIGPGPAQSWSQFMNDAAHTSNGWGPKSLAVAWSKPIGTPAPLASSPVFANGIGYIGSTDKNIYAFNASNGDTLWNFETKAQCLSTPAIANGYLYTGADDGNVYCLDATRGNSIWSTPLPAGPATNLGYGQAGTLGPPSPMVVGNNLYIGDNNYIYCLSTSSGAIKWAYTWGSAKLIATPTIVNDIVYIAPNRGDAGSIWSASLTNPNGFLYLLDAQTGALIKNITIPYLENPFIAAGNPLAISGYLGIPSFRVTGQGIHAPVTVDPVNNIAFVQQVKVRTNAINLTSGDIIWTYDAFYNPGTIFQWGINTVGVLYAQGNCYFNEYYGITCVNALTGNVTWQTYHGRETAAPLSYYAGTVYAATLFNYVYALNAATGEKESFAFCGPGATQPVPYARNLYVASSDFNITCYTQAMPIAIANTDITFELRPSSISKGDTVIVAGSINGVHSTVPMNVYFSKGDSSLPVNISAITDGNGGFTVKYAPDMIGEWTVVASWAGDSTHSAGSSQSQTLAVTEPSTPQPTQALQSAADLYFVPGIIGVTIAIIAVGAILAILMLRKRP